MTIQVESVEPMRERLMAAPRCRLRKRYEGDRLHIQEVSNDTGEVTRTRTLTKGVRVMQFTDRWVILQESGG